MLAKNKKQHITKWHSPSKHVSVGQCCQGKPIQIPHGHFCGHYFSCFTTWSLMNCDLSCVPPPLLKGGLSLQKQIVSHYRDTYCIFKNFTYYSPTLVVYSHDFYMRALHLI